MSLKTNLQIVCLLGSKKRYDENKAAEEKKLISKKLRVYKEQEKEVGELKEEVNEQEGGFVIILYTC